MPTFDLPFFLLGCLGGLMPDILRLIRNRHRIDIPKYLGTFNFWLGTILLVGVGGLTAWLLNAGTAKDALIYGFASPQLLSQLAASATTERVERGVIDRELTATLASEPDARVRTLLQRINAAKTIDTSFNLMRWWSS